LLEASSHHHPLYGPVDGEGLANHLPMALIALDALGASPTQLQRFTAHYSPRLRARNARRPPLEPATALGRRESFEGVHSYFVAAVARHGTTAVLHDWVPQLIPGVSASAFHALIRLAYGLEAQRPDEIVTALAYWVIEYQTLGELSARSDTSLQHIASKAAEAVRGHAWRGRLIIDRMVDVAAHPAVLQLPSQPQHIDVPSIARFALEQYAAREDFTLLHLVTGCYALSLVAPYAGDPERAARYLWQAVLLAFLTTNGSATTTALGHLEHIEWQPCMQAAASSLDDHVIKLVYTAWREFTRTQDPRYRHIATRKVAAQPLRTDE
jgi:hypothetical protein